MARLVWAVFCGRSLIDSETNTASLIDVLENIAISYSSPDGPDVPPPPSFPLGETSRLVSSWVRDDQETPERAELKIILHTPAGNAHEAPQIIPIDLESVDKFRAMMNFGVLPNEGSGRYEFEVLVKSSESDEWVSASRTPIDVTIAASEQPEI